MHRHRAGAGKVLLLSNGLTAKAIGVAGGMVTKADGTAIGTYHAGADGGACFPKADGSGYYYVSNSEIGDEYDHASFALTVDRSLLEAKLTGGVYSFEFTNDHQLVGYKQVLKLTSGNCAGGATPWGSWVSCEERRGWFYIVTVVLVGAGSVSWPFRPAWFGFLSFVCR
jgi:hypothetical protein